jgi:hypothetical protein
MDSVYFELDNCNGELTGIIPLENHIVVTTTKAIYELYGTKPSDFSPRLISTSSGCVNNKTLAEIDNRVYMLSRDGINIYGGSYPQPLSLQLQEKNCVSGTAIGFNRKYYISLYNGSSYSLYVYDTLLQQWHREDDLNVLDFAVSGNNLYALADNGRIYKFNSGTETVSWEAETDRFTEQYLGYKATSKIKIEAELELDSSFSVYVRTDGSEYMRVGTDTTSGYHYFAAYELPRNTFWFQIKLVGSGKCKLYSITREIIVGSDLI